MCTAVTFQANYHYFGRNLDLEYHYNESVTVTPRNFVLQFRKENAYTTHYAMIGVATVADGYPLYYDATNEYGLSIAGLNFPGNAVYQNALGTEYSIAPFEFIPWVLGQCKTVNEAIDLLLKTTLTNDAFSDEYPVSPLHWMIADEQQSITVEPLESGIKIYNNPIGILTNNPPFDFHMNNLANYLNLSNSNPHGTFANLLPMSAYSNGMGALGLPGDHSSASRFIRAAFCKLNATCDLVECSEVNHFFHILGSAEQQMGSCHTNIGLERTIYSSCCNTNTGVFYYKTYGNYQLTAVDMHRTNINGTELKTFPLRYTDNIFLEN